jgi:N-acetylglucosamine-6-phosphate deacetylase
MKTENNEVQTYTGRLMSGECVRINVADQKITRVESIPQDDSFPYVLPVLVDLQQNGGLGTYYNMLEETGKNKLYDIAALLRRNGIGRCLATLTTHPFDSLMKSAALFDETLNNDRDLEKLFFGFFQEGVFISPQAGWRGSHSPKYILKPDWEKFRELDKQSGNRIKVVNVAPEEPGGLDFVEQAANAGKKVTLGHCCPSTEIIRKAVERGASMVTHFGNGAAPQIHRFKNPFWEMLNNDKLKLGLICDGFHLPPELVELAIKIKGRANCYMVSDATGYSGKAPGIYQVSKDLKIVIEKNGYIHVKDSEILSGAWFQLNRGVEFLVNKLGMTFLEAWEQCSLVPANVIGIKLPQIAEGEEASFVIAGWQDNSVKIKHSVHNGKDYS